jgi:hypothetical protein
MWVAAAVYKKDQEEIIITRERNSFTYMHIIMRYRIKIFLLISHQFRERETWKAWDGINAVLNQQAKYFSILYDGIKLNCKRK